MGKDAISQKKAGSSTSPCLHDDDNDNAGATKKQPVKLRVSIFFDGTANNKFNNLETKGKLWFYQMVRTSYGNADTNIATLCDCLKADGQAAGGYKFNSKIYITGVGTATYTAEDGRIAKTINDVSPASDSPAGLALGTGSTGITDTSFNENTGEEMLTGGKVKDALDELFRYVTSSVDNNKETIEKLSINVFGFSRGAAAARTFIHYLLDDSKEKMQQRLEGSQYSTSAVEVFFSGIYDTVPSYGMPFMHKYNTQTLFLTAIAKSVNVVHLTAKDEFRENFSLTNINSKGGKEIALPGAHADVGGGYTDNYDETGVVVLQEGAMVGYESHGGYYNEALMQNNLRVLYAEKNRLVDEGWYHADELRMENAFRLVSTRKNISNIYRLIPLHIMKKYAKEQGLLDFGDIDTKFEIPADHPELRQFKEKITEAGTGNYTDDFELLKKIRHKYFHTSSDYGSTGMSPNYEGNVKKRHIADG